MNNLINLAVTETNSGYANSGIAQRMNLVYASRGRLQRDRLQLVDGAEPVERQERRLYGQCAHPA